MTTSDGLRLIALDADDLAIVSAHVQDALLKTSSMRWMPRERRFLLSMNRFAWEAAPPKPRRKANYERRQTVLHFERVMAVSSSGLDRAATASVLELLALRFELGESPSGHVLIDFSGGGCVRLAVECLEAQLTDLGPAWSTPYAPRHVLA